MKMKINKMLLSVFILFSLIVSWITCFSLGKQTVQVANVDTSLKACPFCGGQASIYYDENKSSVNGSVECDKCGAKFYISFKDSKEEAYNELSKLWNSRVEE